jgi:hypothetical protein
LVFLRRLNFWAFGLSKGNRRSGVFAAFDYFNFLFNFCIFFQIFYDFRK